MLIARYRFNAENVRDYKFVQVMEDSPKLRINLFVRKIKEESSEVCNLPEEVPWEMEEMLIDSIEVDLESLFLPYTRFALPMTVQGKFNPPFNFEEIHASRDGVNMLSFFQDIDNKYTFTIFFGESADKFLLISPFPIKNEYAVTRDNPKEVFSDIICEYYPEYKKKVALRDARRKLLYSADPNESIAYLEAQIDMATKILFSLLEQLPEVKGRVLESVPELALFETKFEESKLFNVKSVKSSLDEFETKAKIRRLQAEYYKEKAKNI